MLSLPLMKARQRIAAYALIAILFANYLGVNILYGVYTVDQSLFVELFCINKENVEMNCNGSCMLSKLDETDKESADKALLADISQFQIYFNDQHPTIEFELLDLGTIKHSSYYRIQYESAYLKEIFHPPTLV